MPHTPRQGGCTSLLDFVPTGHALKPMPRAPLSTTNIPPSGPAAQRTTYCMNEAELVDVALGILIEGHQLERPTEHTALAAADKLECSPTHSRSLWPLGGQEEDEDKEEASLSPSHGSSLGLGDPNSACSPPQVDEEDALKYVREIFFS
ncbi:cell cycle regulator of non-homologous end joining isoform X2 [Tenrec ecaudatus]|uniref:cell cycle regulator of non-homologous end joining isoform X2 n=1 Tax=Tenrec ecaudatus TaxID=94439 RepID=UPI003F5A1C5D